VVILQPSDLHEYTEGIAFSGTRYLTSVSKQKFLDLFLINLDLYKSRKPPVFCFGAATGIDTLAGEMCHKYYSEVPRLVIVPSNKKHVDWSFEAWATHVYYMPEDTDYKDRNEMLVILSNLLSAYPNREELSDPRSGTWQCVRQARAARNSVLVNPLSNNVTIWEP